MPTKLGTQYNANDNAALQRFQDDRVVPQLSDEHRELFVVVPDAIVTLDR